MIHFALIPARAGSKSIINKNLQLVGGKSLVDRTIDCAKNAGFFKEIILSTDIDVLLQRYAGQGVICRRRPEGISEDDSLMSQVVSDCISTYQPPEDSYLWLLQPTTGTFSSAIRRHPRRCAWYSARQIAPLPSLRLIARL